MADYIVEIGDEKGKSFKISVSVTTTFAGVNSQGSWRTIDKGFICFNSGVTKVDDSKGTLTTNHLVLFNSKNEAGIRLNDFHDWLGANDTGTGLIAQPWVLDFTYGRISWALVK